MRQALRDIEELGRISRGVSEHLEHYGIHPLVARMQVEEYRNEIQKLFSEGKAPTMQHLHEWLFAMEAQHYPATKQMMEYMKIDSVYLDKETAST